MEKIVKLIQEDNPQWRIVKDFGCSWSTVSEIFLQI